MENNETQTLILMASKADESGNWTLLEPLYEVDDGGLRPINKEEREKTFRDNEKVFYHNHQLEQNAIVIAQVFEDRQHFKEGKSLYQVVKDVKDSVPPHFACVVAEEIESAYFGDNHKPVGKHFWDSLHIYFKLNNKLAIGPYICKRDDSGWIAKKQPKTAMSTNMSWVL